jgi:DNA-binding response OmpR family regulator
MLDLRLPDTDSRPAAAHPPSGRPAVVVYRLREHGALMHVLDLGHSAYLVKPFDLNELGVRIDAVGA